MSLQKTMKVLDKVFCGYCFVLNRCFWTSIIGLVCILFSLKVEACTIVAVSGSVTNDGRPMLLKNRDSSMGTLCVKINNDQNYTYLCQYSINYGYALAGYNEMGFAIINSDSYNMPNSTNAWNAYIMQQALGKCASVADFEYMMDTITKPISVASNYGVMDAQGNVAIIEANAYSHVRFDADSTDCGYLIRTNFSFSVDTTGVYQATPTSLPRYLISSSYLEDAMLFDGAITKEHLFGLTRCLVNCHGEDLRDWAPFDENSYTPVEFRYYVPRYISNSAMIIQGVLPDEQPKLTVAWTMVGPPMVSVTVPYIITPRYALPQKAKLVNDGYCWFSYMGQMLKNECFVDNTTIDLAKLYNLSETGVMQKIEIIEEEILCRGDKLLEKMRQGGASCLDVEQYYEWIDGYVEEQYEEYNLVGANLNGFNEDKDTGVEIEYYYDILGRRVRDVRPDAIIKQHGNIGIIIR